ADRFFPQRIFPPVQSGASSYWVSVCALSHDTRHRFAPEHEQTGVAGLDGGSRHARHDSEYAWRPNIFVTSRKHLDPFVDYTLDPFLVP
ncbi:MAG: hypothetical protein V3U27_19275, partial [Candidatus Tectomicrobia bacterium]